MILTEADSSLVALAAFKAVAGSAKGPGGFDSHTPPPFFAAPRRGSAAYRSAPAWDDQ